MRIELQILTRIDPAAELAAILAPNILSILDLQTHIASNPALSKILQELSVGKECGGYSLTHGCLKF